jgi:Fic family protein
VPPVIFLDEAHRLQTKQANLYNQQTLVDHLIMAAGTGGQFILTEATIRQLHGVAMMGLLTTAGEYREVNVAIKHSDHQPCDWQHVAPHMADMCDHLQSIWHKSDLVHLAAYTMWRINWIHPFENGNGRTARAASYLVLCAKYGGLLPAHNSVLRQIVANKHPYYEAHRECDKEFNRTQDMACLRTLEDLIERLLIGQLKAAGL